jgi:hypothetical protein
VLFSELQFCVKRSGAGVKTQPHIAISTFKSHLNQLKTPLCTLDIYIYSWFVFCGTHTTLYLIAILRPVITILHFEPAGVEGFVFLMGWFEVKTPFHPL